MASTPPGASRSVSPTPSQLPPVPGSPVYSVASTANPMSSFNLPLPPAPRPAHPVLAKADLERSQEAYSDLVASAKAYRLALASLSTAASAFGSALESCARLKEACAEPIGPAAAANATASFTTKGSCTADNLMSASGVHHLVANHQQILSETVYRSFEVPLLHDLDKWQTVIDEEEETYQSKVKSQSREVKRLEKEGLKLHKQRRRDVAHLRAHLVHLTTKLDGLTTLHADHARTMLRESQETSGRIADASCSLVRAEVDVFESLARKGWTGGGLDDLLERGQDLFAAAAEDDAHAGTSSNSETAKLFSILPPKSILADSASDASRNAHGHARSDSLGMDAERYQSLAGVASDAPRGGDTDSVLSADFNRPRNARPFSPQPIRRIATDVTHDSLGASAPDPGDDRRSRGGEEDDRVRRLELRIPAIEGSLREEEEEDGEGEGEGGDAEDGRGGEEQEEHDRGRSQAAEVSTPESPRGRPAPEFLTDESSSPEGVSWGDERRRL